mmetsp:Transcript_45765/g.99120  ORF Transcript_45765/g.99120 Transcript_45765/m.99120 type:complete len:175 (+) Transcript_45765:142-666(+)
MTYQRVRGGDMSGSFGAYITSASIKDPSHHHAPQGISNVEIMTLVSMSPSHWGLDSQPSVGSLSYRRNDKYQEVKKGLERAMLTHLDKQFPGLADKVVFMESSTPFSHRRFTHGGTAYGLAATPDQFLQHRPGNKGPLQNMFLAGHSTRTGHGVLGAMMGGERVARVVQRALKA